MNAHPYSGRLTCCHSQAILTAYAAANVAPRAALIALELASTVPFGIVAHPADANRLLTCWLDPDIGIDRALDIFGVRYRVRSWADSADSIEAVEVLREWLNSGPAVVGPVDLGLLPYVGLGHIYATCDHYVVVLGMDGDLLRLCDPEGYPLVVVRTHEFVRAWRAAMVPEGRGTFVMRQVLGPLAPRLTPQVTRTIGAQAICNLRAAAQLPAGGGNALRLLAHGWHGMQRQPSLRRGFLFALSIRIQRLFLQWRFAEAIRAPKHLLTELESAIALHSEVLSGIGDAAGRLNDAAAIEDALGDLFEASA